VNVLFGGLPTKRSQKATRREVLNIEPAVLTPPPVVGGTHHFLPRGSMDKLLRTRAFSSHPEAGSRGLQTQQGTHRWWERAQRPFHQYLEEDEARHHSHAHQEHIAFLRHRPWERGYSTGFSGPSSYLRGTEKTTAPSTSSSKLRTSRLPTMPSSADQLSPSSWRYLTTHT
jgi:hypothetical protein